MAAGTAPIYVATPDNSTNNSTGMAQAVTAAGADYTGIDADYQLVFTAGSNGAYLEAIRCKAIGTNVTAVARVFINNGSAVGTATNNTFVEEIDLPATTSSTTASTPTITKLLNVRLQPSARVYVGLGASVAAGWVFSPWNGGQY